MARRPKPWYRKARRAWFVTIDGVQHNLGPDKGPAFNRFYELMREPRRRRVSSRSLAAVIDEFLDWRSFGPEGLFVVDTRTGFADSSASGARETSREAD